MLRETLSSENETTTTRRRRRGTNSSKREREKREEEGKKNVTRLFEEKERNVSKLSSLVKTNEDTGKKKGHKDDVSKT